MTTLRATLVAAILVSGRLVAQAPTVDPDNIGGVVRSPRGPEAGVWVIADPVGVGTRPERIYDSLKLQVATFDRRWHRLLGAAPLECRILLRKPL
jgi:hypothetical protein